MGKKCSLLVVKILGTWVGSLYWLSDFGGLNLPQFVWDILSALLTSTPLYRGA